MAIVGDDPIFQTHPCAYYWWLLSVMSIVYCCDVWFILSLLLFWLYLTLLLVLFVVDHRGSWLLAFKIQFCIDAKNHTCKSPSKVVGLYTISIILFHTHIYIHMHVWICIYVCTTAHITYIYIYTYILHIYI